MLLTGQKPFPQHFVLTSNNRSRRERAQILISKLTIDSTPFGTAATKHHVYRLRGNNAALYCPEILTLLHYAVAIIICIALSSHINWMQQVRSCSPGIFFQMYLSGIHRKAKAERYNRRGDFEWVKCTLHEITHKKHLHHLHIATNICDFHIQLVLSFWSRSEHLSFNSSIFINKAALKYHRPQSCSFFKPPPTAPSTVTSQHSLHPICCTSISRV